MQFLSDDPEFLEDCGRCGFHGVDFLWVFNNVSMNFEIFSHRWELMAAIQHADYADAAD